MDETNLTPDLLIEFRKLFARTTQGKWTDMVGTVVSDTDNRPTVAMMSHSPYSPRNLHECEANCEFVAAAHNYFLPLLSVAEEVETVRHLLSAARDFICEGGSYHLIGAPEFVEKLDQALSRLANKLVDTQTKDTLS